MTRKILILIIVLLPLPYIFFKIRLHFSSTNQNPPVALVFGAGILPNHQPSLVLQSRLDVALKLYQDKKIKAVLVSGDNRVEDYNEPDVMGDYLVTKGIPNQNVIRDYGGRRTVDSCWRARHVFNAKSVYLITQAFHLPRANFLCEQEGLSTEAITAPTPTKSLWFYQEAREVLASWRSLLELYSYQPPIKSNGTEPDLGNL